MGAALGRRPLRNRCSLGKEANVEWGQSWESCHGQWVQLREGGHWAINTALERRPLVDGSSFGKVAMANKCSCGKEAVR